MESGCIMLSQKKTNTEMSTQARTVGNLVSMMVHNSQRVLQDSAASGTGKHCVLGHLGLVFIWSCFVSCLLFISFVLRKLT